MSEHRNADYIRRRNAMDFVKKDNPNAGAELLLKNLADLRAYQEVEVKKSNDVITALRAELTDSKKVSDEQIALVKKLADEAIDHKRNLQTITDSMDGMKKQLDTPIYTGTQKDQDDALKEETINFLQMKHEDKGDDTPFNAKGIDLTFLPHLVKAQRKLIKCNSEAHARQVLSNLDELERKAMTMSQLDGMLFWPEISQVVRDCFLEPYGLDDKYDSFSVSKMSFMYPFLDRHDLMGGFICSEECGTITAATNNLSFRNTRVYDWRGTWCTTLTTLEDAAINIITWMAREMALSYRITTNRAWISGTGVNEPQGWLSSGKVPVMNTSAVAKLSAADLRAFMNSIPYEYGSITAIMNPDTLALFASMTDSTGRFLLGDDQLFLFHTDITDNRVRLSRYMPNLVAGATPGTFVSGGFVAAAANWKKMYITPIRRPLSMQEGYSITGPWCKNFNFWAQVGGDVVCGGTGRILQIQ